MIIREPKWSDKQDIDRIYSQFYDKNEYPDFLSSDTFPISFVIADETGKIIVAGGVKTIAEAVFVTDKERSPTVRLEALLQGLGASIHIAKGMQYNQIHAFVNNDESYVKVLRKFGFKLIDAKLLVLDIEEKHG